MSVDTDPLVIIKENYKTKESKKALFAEVKLKVKTLEEEDSNYGPYSDEKIANIFFSGFNSKFDEFTLLFSPNFETKKV